MKKFVSALLAGITVVCCGMSTEENIACDNRRTEAEKAGDFETALNITMRMIRDPWDRDHHLGIASDYLEAGLLNWCLGNDGKARYFISEAIDKLKYGKRLGNGCEARAEILLERLDRVPRSLSYREFDAIMVFTMEFAYAQHSRSIQRTIAFYDAIGEKAASQTRSLRYQGEVQASMAKFYARRNYEKATGDSFNPNYPPSGGTARDQWNACKRIYDIFGD